MAISLRNRPLGQVKPQAWEVRVFLRLDTRSHSIDHSFFAVKSPSESDGSTPIEPFMDVAESSVPVKVRV